MLRQLKLLNLIPNHPPGEMLSSVLFSFGIALRPGDQQKEEGEGDAVARHIVNVGVDPAVEAAEEATPFSCPDGGVPSVFSRHVPPPFQSLVAAAVLGAPDGRQLSCTLAAA